MHSKLSTVDSEVKSIIAMDRKGGRTLQPVYEPDISTLHYLVYDRSGQCRACGVKSSAIYLKAIGRSADESNMMSVRCSNCGRQAVD